MPGQTSSEGGETASAAEAMKNLFKRNKTKTLVVGGAVIAVVTGMVVSLGEGRDVTGEAEDFEDCEWFPEPPWPRSRNANPPPGIR